MKKRRERKAHRQTGESSNYSQRRTERENPVRYTTTSACMLEISHLGNAVKQMRNISWNIITTRSCTRKGTLIIGGLRKACLLMKRLTAHNIINNKIHCNCNN